MVQALLLHSDVKTTLRLYAQGVTKIESLLKGKVLSAILQQASTSVVK